MKLLCLSIMIIFLLCGCARNDNIPFETEAVSYTSNTTQNTSADDAIPVAKQNLLNEIRSLFSFWKSNEANGVPDDVIISDISINQNSHRGEVTISIQAHDINTKTHRDTVHASVVIEYAYYTMQYNLVYVYQYDKSSDLWTLLKEHSTEILATSSWTDSILHTEWIGTCQPAACPETSYTIYVDGIDYLNGTIHCLYTIENSHLSKDGEAWLSSSHRIDGNYSIYANYNSGLMVGSS